MSGNELIPHPCAVCGQEFIGRASTPYCGWKCRSRSKGVRDKAVMLAAAGCRQEHICSHCGCTFKPKRAAHTQFCSRECGYAYRKANAKSAEERRRPNKCVDCGTAIGAKTVRCSSCYLSSVSKPKAADLVPQSRPCADCGVEMPVEKYRRRCDACRTSRSHDARKAARKSPSVRAAKAMRKALQRGRVPGAERFDPIEVLERDKWRCHMCGVSTPKSLRGTMDERAPELDHIIPLAQGGPHTRANTACSCRRCNIGKGATAVGQLRMFG